MAEELAPFRAQEFHARKGRQASISARTDQIDAADALGPELLEIAGDRGLVDAVEQPPPINARLGRIGRMEEACVEPGGRRLTGRQAGDENDEGKGPWTTGAEKGLEVRPDRQVRHEEFSSSVRNERTIAPGFTPCQGAPGRTGGGVLQENVSRCSKKLAFPGNAEYF